MFFKKHMSDMLFVSLYIFAKNDETYKAYDKS